MGRVVYLEDCDEGVLQWVTEGRVCYVVVDAAGPNVRVVCDRAQ